MENKWKDSSAQAAIEKYSDVHEDIALRVYTSRLIGQILHLFFTAAETHRSSHLPQIK